MAKTRTLLLAATVLLISLAAANAETSVRAGYGKCLDDGSFTFQATATGGSAKTSEMSVSVRNDYYKYKAEAIGSWDKEEVTYGIYADEKQATFTSSKGNMNNSWDYDVVLTYQGCRNPPCESSITLKQCPGFPYSCKLSELEVVSCDIKDNQMIAVFANLNKNQHEMLNPNKDLLFYIQSNKRSHFWGISSAPELTVSSLGGDKYILKFDLQEAEQIESFGITASKCPLDSFSERERKEKIISCKPKKEVVTETKEQEEEEKGIKTTTKVATQPTEEPEAEEAAESMGEAEPVKKQGKKVPVALLVAALAILAIFIVIIIYVVSKTSNK